MFGGMRGGEWLIVLLVVLLLFGARKLPELARSLGTSTREFKRGIQDGSQDSDDQASDRADQAK